MTDPTAEPAPREDRTLSWWPILGALVLAAIVTIVIFVVGAGDDNRNGSRNEDDGGLACPSAYASSEDDLNHRVPADPSGIDGKAALVPNTAPRFVVVCRFTPPKDAVGKKVDTPLDGRVLLKGGTRAATEQLSKAPKRSTNSASCGVVTAQAQPSYLLGFTFDTGIVWVSVPSSGCLPASNGQFSTDADLQSAAARAYATKSWPA